MTIAYLDCFSGVSGDMLLAAFLDAGMPEEYLRQELVKLPLSGYGLNITTIYEQGIAARGVTVDCAASQPLRHLRDLTAIIEQSSLAAPLRKRAIAVLVALA
ncbi:MAG TPA: TIGR00299 family protein, partial [Desulfobulbaceae bacterium]|nr:TIGR00299 family protein [Desulfobulbaceae bacterium]